jgi:putative transposase
MLLVEQHRIDRYDSRFAPIDAAAFAAKNLYNAALYHTRQAYLLRREVIHYGLLDRLMQPTEPYRALPAKVAQWVLKQVCAAWTGFFAADAAWQVDPSKFLGRPRLPKYLDKQGRNLLTYTIQALSRPALRHGHIQPSQLPITISTRKNPGAIQQVRIVPKGTHYVVEVVYEQPITPTPVDSALVAGVDLGLDTLAALTSNQPGFVPQLVSGRPLKAINQCYNQQRTRLQASLPRNRYTSRQLEQLTDKRNRRVHDYLHNASRAIVKLLQQQGIGTIIIGLNPDWKQRIRLGRRINQQFVAIPHARFVAMLRYKAELVGIQVIITEEAYTSKCSFLDDESIVKHAHYAGRRIYRGLFRASDGRTIHADVNASYNIIRKVAPDAFGQGSIGCVVQPGRLALLNRPMVS